ncbi:hypothetical protein M3Y97_01139300 [Aphelenchoides bicaudatus]|nr:hypothetical protein M3Y97_01139300 [Aphelenchoides bicaudatus]
MVRQKVFALDFSQRQFKCGRNLFILLICCTVVSARECYQCVGHEDCLRPKNVTCDHEDFGCAKTIYDHEPFIKKDCLYRLNTQDYIKLTTCTLKKVPELDEKFWYCGCMGKDFCNSGERIGASVFVLFAVSIGRVLQQF